MEYGRYKILSLLGQGGMATVYLAEDPLLQRLVAIKVIQAHLSSNASIFERFTVEAKTIAALRHVNIIEVFDFGVQEDQQYLVMEYIDGQNLQAICQANGNKPMPNTVAAAIICQAADGLSSAERNSVVHRDIKPENLMFSSEGALKIADFGIAHIADEQSRTQTGAVLGSPNFMSPEQIEGVRPTHKTDLFSLGGVFYYVLTGKMPFTGASIPVTMRNICEKAPPAIVELNPEAEPFLVQMVETLLQKNPDLRGEGARWLSNQLRSYLNHNGVVDISEHVKTFVLGLNINSNQTIAEAPGAMSRPNLKPLRAGSSMSLGGQAGASAFKTGISSTMGGSGNLSKVTQAQMTTQATTGAMGPSTRSPLVWIGSILSFCVLVLAGSIVWTRIGSQETAVAEKVGGASLSKPKVSSQPVVQQPIVPNNASPTQVVASTVSARPVNPTPVEKARPVQPRPVREREVRTQIPKPIRNPEPKPVAVPQPPVEQNGFILIKSAPPFAALTINGKPQGETPMNAYLEVPLGKCHVEIVHRLSPPFDTVITISSGFRREFKFKLDR